MQLQRDRVAEGDVGEGCMRVPAQLRPGTLAAGTRGHAGDVVEQRYHIPDADIDSARIVTHVPRVSCREGEPQARFPSPSDTERCMLYTPKWRW